MEIKVTHLVAQGVTGMRKFSDSIARSGRENIGEITWRNACEHATQNPLVTPEQQDALRAWIAEFGAWDRDEIARMSDAETNALLLQFIAGDIQEMEAYATIDAFREACERGETSGRLYPGDNGAWYFYVGV